MRLGLLLAALMWLFQGAAQLDPFDQNVKTGPAVGDRIPQFRAVDQRGQWRDFDSVKGPNGAVVLFHRSADW